MGNRLKKNLPVLRFPEFDSFDDELGIEVPL
jgi:hypothetical protein